MLRYVSVEAGPVESGSLQSISESSEALLEQRVGTSRVVVDIADR